MEHTMDADELASRLTPLSIGPTPHLSPTSGSLEEPAYITRSTNTSGAPKSLVADPTYRSVNLSVNHIYLRPLGEQLPHHITSLLDNVRKDLNPPGPSLDQGGQQAALNSLWTGDGEPQVRRLLQRFLDAAMDPNPPDCLLQIDSRPMAKHTVPNAGSSLRVSNPVPNMLFGYSRTAAFTEPQRAQLSGMGKALLANKEDLLCPFLAIELKGDGPGGTGNMWVATNQCLGASATCVNIAESLNRQLRGFGSDFVVEPVNSAAFSVAMNGAEARLYVTWKHNELDYYMSSVDNFLLYRPKDLIEFRKYVRNILDWGAGKRLTDVRNALDVLLEEGRKIASKAAKSGQSPSEDSSTNDKKRQRRSY